MSGFGGISILLLGTIGLAGAAEQFPFGDFSWYPKSKFHCGNNNIGAHSIALSTPNDLHPGDCVEENDEWGQRRKRAAAARIVVRRLTGSGAPRWWTDPRRA